ncbi:MAG: deoxyribodipyrimidine photo-lyase [Actinobacteria bacterium]|nr:deoxyribodipyrimidine photo-lyase [Actinomycetota bacterium]
MGAMVWFRRDLRVRDNPALREALAEGRRVVPTFCLDDRLLRGRHASGPRTQFLLESLAELDAALRERGGRLFMRWGRPERELVSLAREAGCERVHFAYDVSPFARRRGELVARALERAGVEPVAHEGVNAVDVRAIETKEGRPYAVFSPFHRNWLGVERRPLLRAPRAVPVPDGLDPGRLPELGDLGLRHEVAEPAPGGERAARARLDAFLGDDVADYADNHDALGADRTSRLSPYLHLGCVSPRQIEERLGPGAGPQAFRRQLCWRDFHHHVLFHNPGNARSEYQRRYRGMRWSRSGWAFDAWAEGRTGYPLVDAGMRQLRREGWMHNRARMVVGSFLTKHLGIDWRRGERHFMRLLLDGDEANNNGNWQWIASVGTDPAPYHRRIYNPKLQMERFDPDGRYVRRYVPELASVPDEHLREPWLMPPEVQAEASCVIGRDYPEPIVDHREAREEAIARYREAAGR